MLTLLIFTVAGLFVGYFAGRKETIDGLRAFMIIAGLAVGLLFGFMVTSAIRDFSYGKENFIEAEKLRIVSLVGASEIKGEIFILAGSMGTEDYYKFYYEASDGARIFMKLEKSTVRIYEEDRMDAYVTQIQTYKKSNVRGLWVPMFLEREKKQFQYYAIHVPKGTIKPEINLDLK